jgi:hypothetical protein
MPDGPPLDLLHAWFLRARAAHAARAATDAEEAAQQAQRCRATAQLLAYGQLLRQLAQTLYPADHGCHDWGDEIPF